MNGRVATTAVVFAAVVGIFGLGACSAAEYRALVAGECLPADADVVGRREPDPPRVPCGSLHRYEVFFVGPLDGPDDYPGEEELDRLATRLCLEQFEPSLGLQPENAPDGLELLRLQPSEDSWSEGDREIECIAALPEDMAGSLGEGRGAIG
jgi:hypothetical protein